MKRLLGLLLWTAMSCAVALADHVPQHQSPITWISGGESWVVQKGEEFRFEASFLSRVPISNAHWWITGGLLPIFGRSIFTWSPLGNIEPDRVYTIQLSIRIPDDLTAQRYSGNLMVFHARESSDASNRVYPELLPLKINVLDPIQ
ncbi:MAG: hypothetical protein HY649_07460 [Acidobacteria bacterium]|nr:hypothetical protein [Acidobacteriota bacterium]